jgi:hypothetical protein
MMGEIAQEHVHTRGTVKNWADVLIMNRVEVIFLIFISNLGI